ncbi:MAG: glycosyltransferase family 4 protein [Saprospiraceae bacterium]|nr:glycosyltransferase family 4 protein [Saprospiraceae bacterium]
MRILIINFEYPPIGGGASPVCEQIASYLYQRGHSISVVTMAYGNLPAFEERNGIFIFRIESGRRQPNMSRMSEHLKYLYFARKFLLNHLTEHRYDVTHCHFFISSGILARWVWHRFKIPYIVTPHGSDLPGYNPDHFKLMHVFTPPVIRKIIANCQYIVSPSHFLKDLVTPFIRKNHNKLQVIPNGIVMPDHHEKEKKKIILSTGRLLRRKGFHTLVSAVKNQDLHYELHIAGDGPMKKELEQLATDSKTRIVFHGWLDNKSTEYKELLEEASIYCLVSKFENAPVSILEAMAHGCAIITSDGTGCAEMVGDSGIQVPAEDPLTLKIAINNLINDENSIGKLGKKAMKRVNEKFTWERISEEYEEILIRACQE